MEEDNGVFNELMNDLEGGFISSEDDDEDRPKSNYTFEVEHKEKEKDEDEDEDEGEGEGEDEREKEEDQLPALQEEEMTMESLIQDQNQNEEEKNDETQVQLVEGEDEVDEEEEDFEGEKEQSKSKRYWKLLYNLHWRKERLIGFVTSSCLVLQRKCSQDLPKCMWKYYIASFGSSQLRPKELSKVLLRNSIYPNKKAITSRTTHYTVSSEFGKEMFPFIEVPSHLIRSKGRVMVYPQKLRAVSLEGMHSTKEQEQSTLHNDNQLTLHRNQIQVPLLHCRRNKELHIC